jgi:hypothetical protein
METGFYRGNMHVLIEKLNAHDFDSEKSAHLEIRRLASVALS